MQTSARPVQILALLLAFFLLFTFALPGTAGTADGAGNVYLESADPGGDVQQALERAQQENKQLLVVMGAQWCHDSRGLAATFAEPEMAAILEQGYETVFVDVGYLTDLREITQRFNQPAYFATPTVMIIDPASERLLNASDMHIWGSADSVPLERYVDYFSAYADQQNSDAARAAPPRAAALEQFEQRNAQRLTDAYAGLAPLMRAKDSTGKASADFYTRWREVRKYRMQLQRDIQALREQAAANPEKPLSLPSYEAFSWE